MARVTASQPFCQRVVQLLVDVENHEVSRRASYPTEYTVCFLAGTVWGWLDIIKLFCYEWLKYIRAQKEGESVDIGKSARSSLWCTGFPADVWLLKEQLAARERERKEQEHGAKSMTPTFEAEKDGGKYAGQVAGGRPENYRLSSHQRHSVPGTHPKIPRRKLFCGHFHRRETCARSWH